MALMPSSDRDASPDRMPPGSKADSSGPPHRNSAATLSLVCAILWPICLFVPVVVSQVQQSPLLPNWIATLTELGLVSTPAIGIISGIIGLTRSLRRPELRATGRWRAIVGLALGCLWLVATLFL